MKLPRNMSKMQRVVYIIGGLALAGVGFGVVREVIGTALGIWGIVWVIEGIVSF